MMPKNRLSRSFSTSSVLLTCLSTHCQRVASPSTNFLCDACFEAQKRELTRTLMGSVSTSTNLSNGATEIMNGERQREQRSDRDRKSDRERKKMAENGHYHNGEHGQLHRSEKNNVRHGNGTASTIVIISEVILNLLIIFYNNQQFKSILIYINNL